MKTEIVGEFTQEKEIDWNKPMVVENSNYIIKTTGDYSEKESFEGFIVHYKKSTNEKPYCRFWGKEFFKPITHPITIMFSNE